MEQSTKAFLAFRDRMESALPDEFTERERGVMIAGRGCALAAGYTLSQERKMFGMIGTGASMHSHEQRLLYFIPQLSVDTFADWQGYSREVVRERIQLDRSHEFSIFSFLFAAERIEKPLLKALKKADFQENYAPPGAGWSQARFLVVDLTAGRLYPSPLGKPLAGLMRGLV